jgi:hypothetical protein
MIAEYMNLYIVTGPPKGLDWYRVLGAGIQIAPRNRPSRAA